MEVHISQRFLNQFNIRQFKVLLLALMGMNKASQSRQVKMKQSGPESGLRFVDNSIMNKKIHLSW